MSQEVAAATFLSISAADWLQAGANFLGVAATILGTLYIERKMRQADDEEHVARIVEVVTLIAEAAAAVCEGLPDDHGNIEHRTRSMTMQTTLKSALDVYRFVRADTKVKKVAVWRALKALDDAVQTHGRKVENELQILIADGRHEAVFRINRREVMAASAPLEEAARAVIALA